MPYRLCAATALAWGLTLAGSAQAAPAAPAHPPALALHIEYHVHTVSADGVTRELRYSEQLLRQGEQIWLARILPHHAHSEDEHSSGAKAHKHMDVAAAARWVQRQGDGQLQVRLVNTHERLLVDVPPAEWGQVGFDGQWANAQHLLDPAQIARMKPLARPAPAGARWYQGGSSSQPVQVLWDIQGQFPQRIESHNAQGSQRSVTTARRQPLPRTLPWTQLTGYGHKEYADLLD